MSSTDPYAAKGDSQASRVAHQDSSQPKVLEKARVLSLLCDIGKELTMILDLEALLREIGLREGPGRLRPFQRHAFEQELRATKKCAVPSL